jgi:hypothetical protein
LANCWWITLESYKARSAPICDEQLNYLLQLLSCLRDGSKSECQRHWHHICPRHQQVRREPVLPGQNNFSTIDEQHNECHTSFHNEPAIDEESSMMIIVSYWRNVSSASSNDSVRIGWRRYAIRAAAREANHETKN